MSVTHRVWHEIDRVKNSRASNTSSSSSGLTVVAVYYGNSYNSGGSEQRYTYSLHSAPRSQGSSSHTPNPPMPPPWFLGWTLGAYTTEKTIITCIHAAPSASVAAVYIKRTYTRTARRSINRGRYLGT